MISTILRALKLVVLKPMFLLPAIVIGIINGLVLIASQEVLIENLILYLNELLTLRLNFFEIPFHLISVFPMESLTTILLVFIGFMLNFWLLFSYARLAQNYYNKKTGILEAIGYGFKSIGKIFQLNVFFFLISGFFAVIGFILILLSIEIELIGLILLFAFFIFCFYLLAKFWFTPVIMAVENEKLKPALKESWNFSSKHFWGIIFLILIVMVIVFSANLIALTYGLNIESITIYYALTFIISLIMASFTSIVFPLYYLEKKFQV
jgi:amino acid transporter